MKEMKIEQITKEGAPTVYQIWDSLGYTVVLNAEEALLVLDFLQRNLGELTREVNAPSEQEAIGEDGEPYINLYATQNPRDPIGRIAPGDTGPGRDTGEQEAL